MRTMIAVPSMDQVPSHFARSLAMLEKHGEVLLGWEVGSLIYHARDNLAKQAVEAEVDKILWLDSDMVFHPSLLNKLLALDCDFATGLYFRRVPPFSPVLFEQLDIDEPAQKCTWREYTEIPDKPFKVAGCGFGCVLLSVEVLKAVFQRYKSCFLPLKYYGEDLAFCLRAKEVGYKIYADPTAVVGHVGHIIVYPEDHERWKAEISTK